MNALQGEFAVVGKYGDQIVLAGGWVIGRHVVSYGPRTPELTMVGDFDVAVMNHKTWKRLPDVSPAQVRNDWDDAQKMGRDSGGGG